MTRKAMVAWMVREAGVGNLPDAMAGGTACATRLAEAYAAEHDDADLDDELDPVWEAALDAADVLNEGHVRWRRA